MAHSTLPVLPHPEFPQPRFSQLPYDGGFIDRLVALAETVATRVELSFCSGESSESSVGAADGGEPCRRIGTIHDSRTGLSWCVGCFEGVILG